MPERRLAWLIAVAVTVAPCLAARQAEDAAALLSASRRALGGDAALSAVTSFTVSESLARQLKPGEPVSALEIKCALPDRFVVLERQTVALDFVAGRSDFRYSFGFSGEDLIRETSVTPSFPPPPSQAGPDLARRQISGAKHAFAQLAAAMFAGSFAGYPLEFQAKGRVAASTGPADAIDARGPDGFSWRLLLDASSHLPVKLSWMAPPAAVLKTPVGPLTPPELVFSSSTEGMSVVADTTTGVSDVEWEVLISGYRQADGLTWPHRLVTTYGGKPYQDVRLGKFEINPKINPDTFKPSK